MRGPFLISLSHSLSHTQCGLIMEMQSGNMFIHMQPLPGSGDRISTDPFRRELTPLWLALPVCRTVTLPTFSPGQGPRCVDRRFMMRSLGLVVCAPRIKRLDGVPLQNLDLFNSFFSHSSLAFSHPPFPTHTPSLTPSHYFLPSCSTSYVPHHASNSPNPEFFRRRLHTLKAPFQGAKASGGPKQISYTPWSRQ